MKIFFDGGHRPPGMEWAVVLGGDVFVQRDLGPGSAMAAEWLALIAATQAAIARGVTDPILLGDALAVLAQASGKARIPPPYRSYHEHWSALPRPDGLRLRHVKRTQNLAGIALARQYLRQPGVAGANARDPSDHVAPSFRARRSDPVSDQHPRPLPQRHDP